MNKASCSTGIIYPDYSIVVFDGDDNGDVSQNVFCN